MKDASAPGTQNFSYCSPAHSSVVVLASEVEVEVEAEDLLDDLFDDRFSIINSSSMCKKIGGK